jgi:uncharacterized membrane protein YphA (DoxX/SURF4 family)
MVWQRTTCFLRRKRTNKLVYNGEMDRKHLSFCLVMFFFFLALAPHISAHEVYVLKTGEVQDALSMTSPNPLSAVASQTGLFLFSGLMVAIMLILVLVLSLNQSFQRAANPALARLKRFAPFIGRLTLGLALVASGYYQAAFGPELPIGPHLSLLLLVLGILIILGCLTRLAALVSIVVFALSVWQYHWYMLTYLNYFGEMLLAFIVGGGLWSLDRNVKSLKRVEEIFSSLTRFFERYSFLILRICFGVALFFASFYAKFLHSNLALDTVNDYHLTNYFPFTPLFLVLGAFLVEAIFGLFFFFGLEIRFMAIAFTFFLTLSILFFGEAVWPHIILFGVNFALFAHGYDKYTVGILFQRKRIGEPVL